ncbi:MAG: SMI1/KNR4 family protein [Pyrinomonadaceae bacterium]
MKNGFYAFESALHVFPSECKERVIDLDFWNDQSNWKADFCDSLYQILFFAEDLFGGQFGIAEDGIVRFNPETGETVPFSENIEEWAARILNDYPLETGYELAADWQKRNGPIPSGFRLLPIKPFFLGGKFEVDNLYLADALEGMKSRAEIWRQTNDLPDGTPIEFRVVE